MWLAWPVAAQQEFTVSEILESVGEGEARGVLAAAADRVEIAVLGTNHRYRKTQAVHVLRSFFESFPPERFGLEHSMTQGSDWWLIGHYAVKGLPDRMRIYLHFSNQSKDYRLVALHVIGS